MSEISNGDCEQFNLNSVSVNLKSWHKDSQKREQEEVGETLLDRTLQKTSTPKIPPISISYFKLFKYATPWDTFLLFIGGVCSVLCGAAQALGYAIFGKVTGHIVEFAGMSNNVSSNATMLNLIEEIEGHVLTYAIEMSSVGFALIALTYVANVSLTYSAIKQISYIRKRFLTKMLDKEIEWYDLNQTSDFASSFTESLSRIEDGIGEKVGLFLFYESTFVSSVIMALCLGWKLALVCLVSLPLTTIIMGVVSWLSTIFAKDEMEAYAAAGIIAEEALSAIRTVVAFDGQKKEVERYEKHLNEAKKNNIKKHFFNGISNGVMWFSLYCCYALSFWYGVGLILEDRVNPMHERIYTPGTMVSIFTCTLFASWTFVQATPFFETFGIAKGSAEKVFPILESRATINRSKVTGKQYEKIKGDIRFERVHFHYPSRPEVKNKLQAIRYLLKKMPKQLNSRCKALVASLIEYFEQERDNNGPLLPLTAVREILKGFDLTIESGQTVALVGSSGCGKSTCVQLLQRFYDSTAGNIYLDGHNIKELNLTWLRQNIGIVCQEPVLFAATIAENIKISTPNATQAEVEAAAAMASAHGFISKLPQGYNTLIGERGVQLSGGQKQRVAIARALIKQPAILLLDEATSALDSTSEAEVQAALNKVIGTRTTILVAHRLSTVRSADKIVVLGDGQIIEQGKHSELIERKGAYYTLVTSQQGNNKDEKDQNKEPKPTQQSDLIKQVSKMNEIEMEPEKEALLFKIGKAKKTSTFLSLMRENAPEWPLILMGCISAVVIGASTPIYALVFGDIIGVLAHPDNKYVRTEANKFCLYFVIIAIAVGSAFFFQLLGFGIAGERLTFRLRRKLFASMLSQEIGWFDVKENGVGALCSQLATEASSVQGAAGMRIGTVMNALSVFVLAHLCGFYLKWKLTLVLLGFGPLIFIAIWYEQKIQSSDAESSEKTLQHSTMIALEAISNIRTVVSLNAEKIFYNKFVMALVPYVKAVKTKTHVRSLIVAGARALPVLAYAAAIPYGMRLVIDEGMPYGTIYKVAESIIASSWAIGIAFAFSPNMQSGMVAAKRIFTLLRRVPEIRHDMPDAIMDWVYFSYPTRASVKVLNGLDLTVLQGKTIALVGSSGCGKSTIVQLLERFYDPDSGGVYAGDTNTKSIDLSSLRSRMGIVSQEPNLFDRTIAENIAYGCNSREVTMEEIIEAAKQANIHSFVMALPLSYDTRLGTRGTQLSGGQKQRIAIARALVRKPAILLLDEATSALDNESEKVVQKALDAARAGRTCITIAHRLTTIQDADVICVLQNGKVVETGTHEQLRSRNGHYYNFYKFQCGEI